MNTNTQQHRLSIRRIAAVILVTTGLAWHASIQAQAPATQSSSQSGVTVKVTPKPIGPGASDWEFAVVLDTHSAELSDDLLKSAVLIVDGSELAPLAWVGAAPGGHHRAGVLKFPMAARPPEQVELRIQRAGETAARVFRWDGAALR